MVCGVIVSGRVWCCSFSLQLTLFSPVASKTKWSPLQFSYILICASRLWYQRHHYLQGAKCICLPWSWHLSLVVKLPEEDCAYLGCIWQPFVYVSLSQSCALHQSTLHPIIKQAADLVQECRRDDLVNKQLLEENMGDRFHFCCCVNLTLYKISLRHLCRVVNFGGTFL